MKNKKTIGWREYVSLPEWGIKKLRAKIDTGAKSSSLHAENIKIISDDKIKFSIILNNKSKKRVVTARPIHKGNVKSSIGHKTHRWYIQTKIKIGNVERMTRINLTSRKDMNFRMIIGRTTLTDNFLVDVAQEYLLDHK